MADPDDEKGFDFDIPVVASRREFFEQEALVSGPPESVDTDLEPDQVAENLKSMREAARLRTESAAEARDGSSGQHDQG
ncbi:MAG TPA: hypothetical protein VHL54_07845 [Actinomycetota bacterium]|nr:hypothetical protein [Actinomycetota bacterium]